MGATGRETIVTRSVIVGGARTPIGKFGGGFRDLPAVDLGAAAIREALRRGGIQGDQVDYVIMGQVIQAGAGQITARQAAVAGGVPKEVPAITINKVCLSGLNAVALADQLIRAGEFDVVVVATGFGTGLETILRGVPDVVSEDGQPLARSGQSTAAFGLYFIGFDETIRGHLFEARRDSKRLARRVARTLENS